MVVVVVVVLVGLGCVLELSSLEEGEGGHWAHVKALRGVLAPILGLAPL